MSQEKRRFEVLGIDLELGRSDNKDHIYCGEDSGTDRSIEKTRTITLLLKLNEIVTQPASKKLRTMSIDQLRSGSEFIIEYSCN